MSHKKPLSEIEYMLSRTAGLLLSDYRNSTMSEDISSTFGIKEIDKENNLQIILLAPLLLSLNACRLSNDFFHKVIAQLDKIIISENGTLNQNEKFNNKNINWSATFHHIYNGGEGYKLKKNNSYLKKEKESLFLIALEYNCHLELLLAFLDSHELPAQMLQISTKVEEINVQLTQTLNKLRRSDPLIYARLNIPSILPESFSKLLKCSLVEFPNYFAEYEIKSNQELNLESLYTPECIIAKKWRESYLSLKTGLGNGSDLLIKPTTENSYLFELWCFYEFVNVLANDKKIGIAQNCFLSSKKNLKPFSIYDNGNVYYNFQGKTLFNYSNNIQKKYSSKILKRTCVEWFIEYGMDRIIFDTKYKNWNSADNLTVIGYMSDFSANIGVVIFDKNFDKEAYDNPDFLNNEIAVKKFSDNGRTKKFIALQLTPNAEHHDLNQETLKILAGHLFTTMGS